MPKTRSPKVLTKKHLARQERERRQTRIILGIAISIIAVIFLAPISYWAYNMISPNFVKAVTVNGESRTIHEFQLQVRVTRENLISQYMQYTQLAQMFGMDPTSDPQLSQSLNQITTELDNPSSVGSQAIDLMVDDLLIRQYAKANGITVSSVDVEKAAQEALRYFPDGTPTPTITPTEIIYPTLDSTQLALVTPTVINTPTTTLTPELSTPTPSPTFTPSPTNGLTSTATPIPSPTPTATPYTLEGYQKRYQEVGS